MNREDRGKFLALIEEKAPALLAGVNAQTVTDEQIMALVAQAMTSPPSTAAVATPVMAPAVAVPSAVLEALLAAQDPPLRYQDHVAEQVEEGGVTRSVWRSVYRPLTVADVIGSRDAGTAVIVVAGDGRKYSLPKG